MIVIVIGSLTDCCSALVIMQLYSPDLTVMIVLACKYILNVIGSRFFLSIAANLQ